MAKAWLLMGLLVTAGSAFAQLPPFTDVSAVAPYRIRYVSNLGVGDSVINITNDGSSSLSDGLTSTATGFQQDGQICANIYAYSPDEQLVSCCACNVTPNGLMSLSAKNDLASNTLTPIIPSALVIKILATRGGSECTAASPAATIPANEFVAKFAVGLHAWATTLHALPVTPGSPATTYAAIETAFSPAGFSNIDGSIIIGLPSVAEHNRMTQLCAFIRANGSGYGICKSCKVGGLGASGK